MDTRGVALVFPGKPKFVPQCVAMPALEEATHFMPRAECGWLTINGELLDRDVLFIAPDQGRSNLGERSENIAYCSPLGVERKR